MSDSKIKKDNVHKGHRDRIRQKVRKSGFQGFTDHEILEFLLFHTIPQGDTNPIAHNLINEFRTLSGVCDADVESLTKIEGVGEKSAIFLNAIPKIANAYITSKNAIKSMRDYESVLKYFQGRFIGITTEKIIAVCLDDKLNLIADSVICDGEPGTIMLNVRKIAEFTYKHNCTNLIISHNHPNSSAIPSDDDIKATQELYKTLKPVGINLLDHIIVGNDEAISLDKAGAFSFLR